MLLRNTLSSIFTHRELIWEISKRDLKSLNKGALLGYLWIVLSPLIQVAAYVIVVSFIFRSRLGENSGPLDYAIYVLSGMIPWQIITKSLQDATSMIRDRMELVKQVIYPIETLPLTSLMVSSFGSFVSLLFFMAMSMAVGAVHWTIIFLPIPFILLTVFVLGMSWVFSIIGVIIKDLREIVSVVLGLMVFLSPVVLNESIVGSKMWRYIMLNPLAHIIICFRDVFYATFHMWSWVIFAGMSLGFFLLGGWVITRTKLLINEYI